MKVLGIDPGPVKSAWCVLDGTRIVHFEHEENDWLLAFIDEECEDVDACAIERIESYGMAVGREVFETCFWTGRLMEAWIRASNREPLLMPRRDVKMHLCNSVKANDSNIRQAIVDKFGGKERAIGKKASAGPLYGISGDVWAALAIALTYAEKSNAHNGSRIILADDDIPF